MSNYTSNTASNKRRPYQKPSVKLIPLEDNNMITKYEGIVREAATYSAQKKVPENPTPNP